MLGGGLLQCLDTAGEGGGKSHFLLLFFLKEGGFGVFVIFVEYRGRERELGEIAIATNRKKGRVWDLRHLRGVSWEGEGK